MRRGNKHAWMYLLSSICATIDYRLVADPHGTWRDPAALCCLLACLRVGQRHRDDVRERPGAVTPGQVVRDLVEVAVALGNTLPGVAHSPVLKLISLT